MKKILTNIRYLFEGISNLFVYTKTIFKDKDHDQYYFYALMEKKLKRMLLYYQSQKHLSDESYVQRIVSVKRAIALIEKVKTEFYLTETFDYYSYCKIEFISGKPLDFKIEKDNLDEYFNKYKIKVDLNLTSEQRVRIANDHAILMHNKARKLLFKTIEQYVEGWWD